MKKVIVISLLLASCASTGTPQYQPEDGSYAAWRDCRVAYEDEHNPGTAHGGIFGAIENAEGNAKLEGPAMTKAVDGCMAQKGFWKVK